MVIRWPVTTRGQTLHLGRERCYLEAQFVEQPREEAVVLIAEAASALLHYLVVQKRKVELDSSAAVYREVFKRHRHHVTGVQRP